MRYVSVYDAQDIIESDASLATYVPAHTRTRTLARHLQGDQTNRVTRYS